MNFNDYQAGALRTWPSTDELRMRRANAALGLAGEAGELGDLVKKIVFHGHDYPISLIEREIGDVLFYAAVLAAEFGIHLDAAAMGNQVKLRARYPEGYSDQASKEREDVHDES